MSNFLGEERLTTTSCAGPGSRSRDPPRQRSGASFVQVTARFEVTRRRTMFFRRRFEQNPVFVERKRRENDAPRLAFLAPALESLRIEIYESGELPRAR